MATRSTEVGHHSGAIFKDQDGKMQLSTGAAAFALNGSSFDFESGAHLRIKDGASLYVNGTLNITSAAPVNIGTGTTMTFSSGAYLTLSSGAAIMSQTVQIMTTKGSTVATSFLHGHGVSVIRPNGTGGTYRLKKPIGKGVMKTIIIQSTLVNKVSCTSTAINFGDTGTPQMFSFTATPSTQVNTKGMGWAISLIGLSSSVWGITGCGSLLGSSLNEGVIALATST